MKKLIAAALCLVMVLSLFAGCNQGTPATTTKPAATNPPATSGKTETTAAPTTTEKEPVTITIALPISANVQDYDTNSLTLWLEETVGCNIEFMKLQTSASDYKSQISTMLLDPNAELPDIYYNIDLGTNLMNEYGEDGYLMDLTPFYEDKEKSAIFWDRLDTLAAWNAGYADIIKQRLVANDGNMYAFPSAETSFGDSIDSRVFINQEWLDKLNLPIPTTLEEFYNTLVAFRDQDPNGNGQKDEIPILGRQGWGASPIDMITNYFIYADDVNWFNVDDDGKLYLPFITEKYREALIYMKKLVDENLMPASVFSIKNSEVKGMLNYVEGGIQTIGVVVAHPTTIFTNDHDAATKFSAMPYYGCVVQNEQENNYRIFMSSTCENPDVAWEILMQMFSWEGGLRMRKGVKGVNWDIADPGALTVDGEPAQYKSIGADLWSTIQNEHWASVYGCSMFYEIDMKQQVAEDANTATPTALAKAALNKANKAYAKEAMEKYNPKNVISALIYTPEENDLIGDLKTNCTAFIKNARATFVCGTEQYNDPTNDDQWASYVAELEKMGLSTWTKVAQSNYDRNKG